MRGTELVPENVLSGILDAVAMIDGLFVSSPPEVDIPLPDKSRKHSNEARMVFMSN